MNPSETQCAFDQDPGLASNGQALAVACSASPKTRTERQREASRINGARSRGPRTQLGKARVRQNALVHGIYARCLPLRDTILFSRREFSRALAALEEEVRPQSQHARMLMERYLVDSFRLQTLLRLLDHEFDPNHGDRTHLFYGNYWQDVEHPAPVEPYARMALVLRKIRSGFQGEAVVCTEEEMVDAVDVLWLVLHHPDKNVEVRDSQATSRAEFEILFQELLETYKATEKQKPRRRSGKAKPTTLDQLQAASLLAVSPRVVSNLVRRREIPYLRISRKCLRFRRNEIERWAEKHETKPI